MKINERIKEEMEDFYEKEVYLKRNTSKVRAKFTDRISKLIQEIFEKNNISLYKCKKESGIEFFSMPNIRFSLICDETNNTSDIIESRSISISLLPEYNYQEETEKFFDRNIDDNLLLTNS